MTAEDLIKAFDELKGYKKKYEHAISDKQTMSDRLYKYMLKEYEIMSKEERIAQYKKDTCSGCRYRDTCDMNLPEDISKPFPSDMAWIPPRKGCKYFEWA